MRLNSAENVIFCFISYILINVLSKAVLALQKECETNEECHLNWPDSVCRRSRCVCKSDSIRRASHESSHGWVCLSLFDIVTGQLGPPLTCPLPDGAGFRMILKNSEEKIVFCNYHGNSSTGCPNTHECIKAIGTFSDQWNGVCCPKKEITCQTKPEFDSNGYLERWYFNGFKCEKFLWNPESTISTNTFVTETHCLFYCAGKEQLETLDTDNKQRI